MQAIVQHDVRVDFDAVEELNYDANKVTFAIPDEHSRIFPSAKLLLKISEPADRLLIMPTDWGAWPSSHNWHLYTLLRKACGADTLLIEEPCHCFSSDEFDLALDFLHIFLMFSLDFAIFAFRHREILTISNDGLVVCHVPNRRAAVEGILEEWGDPFWPISHEQPN